MSLVMTKASQSANSFENQSDQEIKGRFSINRPRRLIVIADGVELKFHSLLSINISVLNIKNCYKHIDPKKHKFLACISKDPTLTSIERED